MAEVQIVEHDGLMAIGFPVEGGWQDLVREMPEAWRKLFALRGEIDRLASGVGGYVGISIDLQNGYFWEFVGLQVQGCAQLPDGMEMLSVPANRYLNVQHDGALVDIYKSFEKLKTHGEQTGLALTEVKLDFGYDQALSDRPHDLYMALAPARRPIRVQ